MNFNKVLRIMPFILAGLIVILVCLIIIGNLDGKNNDSKNKNNPTSTETKLADNENETVDWEKDGKKNNSSDKQDASEKEDETSKDDSSETPKEDDAEKVNPKDNEENVTETPTPTPEPEDDDNEYGLKFDEKQDFVEVKAGSNIREGASENATVITNLNEVKRLERTGYNTLWTRVIYNGQECYVATKLVTGVFDKIAEEKPTEKPEEIKEKNDYIEIKAGTNIRKEASTDATIVATVDKVLRLKRISDDGDWSKVEYEGNTCYVANIVITGTFDEPAPAPSENTNENPEENNEKSGDPDGAAEGKKSSAGGIYFGSGSGKLICIDPGHQTKGNYNTEAVAPGSSEKKAKVSSGTSGKSTGLPEYKLNLTVAMQLKDELIKRGYRVVMTRTENDVDISNIERATIANENNADAFIRVHANGSDNSSVSGIETICQTKNNKYVSDIYEECRELSDKVLDGMVNATGGKKRGVWETDTMSGINWSKVPVTIVEMGFMTNAEEDQLLSDPSYQKKIVKGIADGIDAYFS